MKHILAINLGATNIRGGVVSENGNIKHIFQRKLKTHAKKGLESYIFEFIEDIFTKAKKSNIKIEGIGVGSPGPIDLEEGIIKEMPNFPEIQNWNLKKDLKNEFKIPIEIEKDTSTSLIGEIWKGEAKNKKNAVLLTLGTGVGGAALVGRKILRGSSGEAAEFGHITIDPKGKKCGCGKNGCLETFCGGRGIIKLAREKGMEAQNAKTVFDYARKGDGRALEVLDKFKLALKIGMGDLINIFNPELVIIGGKIALSSDLFLDELKKELNKYCFRSFTDDLEIKKSDLIDEAGLLGVSYLFFEPKFKFKNLS